MKNPANSMRSQSPKFSIRYKLMVSILSVVLLFGSIHIYVVFQIVNLALKEEFYKKGVMLARHLGYQLEEAVLYEDETALQQMLWQWKFDAYEHGYALVILADREVAASTFVDGIPVGLVEANLPSGDQHQFRRIVDGEDAYLDVAVPLLEGMGGWVRLGLHEEPVRVPAKKILTWLLGMIIFFVILGISGAIIFSRRITRPIDRIVNKFKSIELSGDPVKLDIHTGDEIEVLSSSFEEMSEHLIDSHSQLSEAIRKSSESQKLAALGVMASGIAHEINNPLAGLKIGLKRIARDPKNSEQVLEYMPHLMHGLDHIEDIVKQVLLFAKPEALHYSNISISDIINHAMALVHHKVEEKDIILNRIDPAENSHIWIDRSSIIQILVNLMLNAIDEMPGGGEMTVRTEREKDIISISISDTGKGIKAEDMERIWEPFFTTKDTGQGTGLGLSVTRTLIDNLSGTVQVNSEPGVGSEFRVSLPIERIPS